MLILHKTALALTLGVSSVLAAAVGNAATTVQVSLWDSGDHALDTMGEAAPMGPAMMPADQLAEAMKTAQLGVTVDVATVPAGEVTFVVTNNSKSMQHEMLVVPVADPAKPLPYNADEMHIDEELAGGLGEVPELDTGATGSLTLTLTPGTYMLYCNIPGHVMMGMWSLITVTG